MHDPESTPKPSVPIPADDDGVDVTLIRWMLSLTPSERLEVAQSAAESIEDLRRAVRKG